ncbi:MAG TPA: hypothetical protein DCZ41_04945 [Firmicutes bacterium]|nr:hypothetical protein [Bacillota bacterium]
MEKKIDLTIDAIYKEKFEKDVKGYNAEQVDIFLDRIIRDYDTFSEIISSKDAQIASLKAELSKTKEQIANADVDYERLRSLERENSVMAKRLESIKPGDTPNAENLRYIQRVNALESFLFNEGYDVKTLKKRSN